MSVVFLRARPPNMWCCKQISLVVFERAPRSTLGYVVKTAPNSMRKLASCAGEDCVYVDAKGLHVSGGSDGSDSSDGSNGSGTCTTLVTCETTKTGF